MKLSEISIPSAEVALPNGQSLTVRGLCLDDIILIFRRHSDALETLYASAQAREATGDQAELTPTMIAAILARKAPDAMADIIAQGCGEPGMGAVAKDLPLAIQLAVLEAIGTLTFQLEGGDGKKAREIVIQALQEGAEFVGSLTHSQSGSEVSAARRLSS